MILMIYGGLFDLDNKIHRKDELDQIINSVDFWNSPNKDDNLKDFNSLNNLISEITQVKNKIESNISLLKEELDDDMFNLIIDEYKELNKEVNKLRIDTFLSGEFDKNDCLLEIHSGAGGTEACDWANMLYRMYTRYLSKNALN